MHNEALFLPTYSLASFQINFPSFRAFFPENKIFYKTNAGCPKEVFKNGLNLVLHKLLKHCSQTNCKTDSIEPFQQTFQLKVL